MPRLDFSDYLKIPPEELRMPNDALQATEDASAAVAKAPRITKQFIEENIVEQLWATGDAFVAAADGPDAAQADFAHLTICLLRVSNGFIAVGKSAPMSPANFNAPLGRQLAYEDAFRQLWPLYAFAQLEEDFLVSEDLKEMMTNARNNDGEPSPNSAESKPAE